MPEGTLATLPAPPSTLATVTVSVRSSPKVAVTARFAVSERLQPALPAQSPLQPTKYEPGPGVAASATGVPLAYSSVQSPGQAMPPGVLATEPPPGPATATSSARNRPNVAVTVRSVAMVKLQAPLPEQAPLQPLK